jgi:hypothetical protein
MPCHRIADGIVCTPTVRRGQAQVGPTLWRWEYSPRFGPLWLRKDGEPRECQNPKRAAWDAFERWLDEQCV